MFCKDDSITYLNNLGYNVVKLPRENIKPLLVITGEKGKLEPFGHLSDLIIDARYEPSVIYNEEMPTITGKKSNKLDMKVGIDLLDRLLLAMGTTSLGIEAAYKNIDSIRIIFKNVLSDTILPIEIDKYLSSGRPKTGGLLDSWIDSKGKAYLITETIKSNAFGVIAYDKNGYSCKIDVSGIEDILGGSGEIRLSIEQNNTVFYEGKKFLVFGFKALYFWIDKNQESPVFRLAKTKDQLVMKGKYNYANVSGKYQYQHVLLARHALLEIDF